MTDYNQTLFENIKHLDDNGAEYWNSRELAQALEYSDLRNFDKVIEKAKQACQNSNQNIDYHFVDVTKMIEFGKGEALIK